jgi:hypothetical protein
MSTNGRIFIIQKLVIFIFLLVQSNLMFGQETVSFRTDRDIYVAGEPVWINVKCVKTGTATASDLSDVAYVEILNAANVPVTQLKIHFNHDGIASTRFVLPDTLSTDNYRLRGYTKWMRNYNADLYFSKIISVINPFVNKIFPKGDKAFGSDTVIFYPEGGRVISGAKNQLIFQSLDAYAQGKSVSGFVISDSGDTIMSVTSNSSGIGKFNLVFEEQTNYSFLLNTNGKTVSLQLPRSVESGYYGIHLADITSTKIVFEIVSNRNIVKQKTGYLHIASAGGRFLKSYPVSIKAGERIIVENGNFPDLLLFASLIDDTGKELSSRYFKFSDPVNPASIVVKTDKLTYNRRSKVSLDIANSHELSDVSVSVVKSCLLNDAPGVIGQTGIPDASLKRWQTDNLSVNDMLACYKPVTNILANRQQIQFLPEMEGEIISGVILEKESGRPIVNKSYILSFVGKVPIINITKTDSSGRFNYISNRYGEREIVIQPMSRDTMDLNYRIDLDMPFSNSYGTTPIKPLYMDSAKSVAVNRAIINMQLNKVYQPYNSYPIKPVEPIVPFPFYGKPESTITMGHFIDLPTMEDVIREIVPQVYLRRDRGEYYFYIYDATLKNQNSDVVFSLVDGVPVWDAGRILMINPEEMDRIEVIRHNYYLHRYNLGAILNLFTAKGDLSAMDFDKRIFRQSQQCYSYSYNFNSPDYSVDSVRTSRIPDFRNLLYWDAEVTFSEEGKANATFYTSDEVSDYTIVVEGLNAEGVIERTQYSFEVPGK